VGLLEVLGVVDGPVGGTLSDLGKGSELPLALAGLKTGAKEERVVELASPAGRRKAGAA
jgi:hypothetical protein